MVSGARWHKEPRERAEVAGMLTACDIDATEALLCFQEQFGGLEYQIRGRPEGWRFGLFGDGVAYLLEAQFARALDHRTEKLAFAIHYLSGEIFVNDYSGWIPIASSAHMIIESDAMIDEIVDVWGTGVYFMLGYYDRGDCSFDKTLLQTGPDLTTVGAAGDQYTTWWAGEQLRVVRRAHYCSTEPQDCIEAYARDVTTARHLAAALIDQGVVKADAEITCFPHPFHPTPVYRGRP